MLGNFFNTRKSVLLLVGLTVLAVLVFVVWGVLFIEQAQSEPATESPLKFEYCGSELRELCLLSFGRDADGNAIINFFVPERDFPDFYLKISRYNGESVYVCVKSEEVPTSVICMGDVINLNERIEISIMSTEDYRLLARGTFTLMAILISSQAGISVPVFPTQATSGPLLPVGTNESITPTPTSPVSYPSYP
jgi:hypothetical protein